MHEPLPRSGRLPAHLKIKYGPVDLLGRFFLWADSAARDRGVTLSFGSLQDLLEVNRGNSDSWRPLVPVFDEALGGVTPETAFVLLGRNKHGEVVTTQAARIYDWPGTSLQDEAASLRMFFADPDAAFARGDRCKIATPMAGKIRGRVVFPVPSGIGVISEARTLQPSSRALGGPMLSHAGTAISRSA
jgi:hypothetical protein